MSNSKTEGKATDFILLYPPFPEALLSARSGKTSMTITMPSESGGTVEGES